MPQTFLHLAAFSMTCLRCVAATDSSWIPVSTFDMELQKASSGLCVEAQERMKRRIPYNPSLVELITRCLQLPGKRAAITELQAHFASEPGM